MSATTKTTRWAGKLERLDPYRWRIRPDHKPGMRTDGIIYASERMIDDICSDTSPEQVANVACLPGIVGHSMAMPDIHYGYGFPIGGVAAFRVEDGVVSPGGVGYDINCGVRLLRTNLRYEEVKPRLRELVGRIFEDVPSGVGRKGRVRVNREELARVLTQGAQWAVAQGMGRPEDPQHLESQGKLPGADPSLVSERAMQRGQPQLGTLGAGNHFLEVQTVDTIYDPATASALGIDGEGQVTVMIHTGSRGLGHQVCDDYLEVMQKAVKKYHIELPDRQLACAPVTSPEAQNYLAAMACAANYAWANRQCITHWTREAFERILGVGSRQSGLEIVYDVAHNIAKIEEHVVDGRPMRLCVHRKGATRAFPPGHPELAPDHRQTGQPVLVPGDMGTHSYLLVGTQQALQETWGSTCHGAGRMLSRAAATRLAKGRNIAEELAAQGVYVRAASPGILAEEMPAAYKDVDQVVEVCDKAGISRRVARLRPIGVMKG